MDTLNHIIVGLDLSEMDETLISYTALLCAKPGIERVVFLHVRKDSDVPDEVFESFGGRGSSEDETIHQHLSMQVLQHFAQLPHVQTEVVIMEGSPLKELLHLAKQHQADLFIVGRKLRISGSGILPRKLLRNGRLSVLFVPETGEPKLEHLVVGIDYSDYSMLALDQVLHTALNRPGLRITCLHVYDVPTGYITLGIKYEDFETRMRRFAEEKFEQVLTRFPELRERASLKLVKQEQGDDVAGIVLLEAKRARADMLVIGAKGKSAAALFVLGSITEKILNKDNDIPLMVFKKKNEEIGFLDALIS
ncbi:universal stress protein [Pontibacter burrus]|uniref:Universal stress protein n=1 Tax=Pontibacter burrus TaxID=2704466 RepID=A0A6B3LUS3_9BACT|nr:universal stress protein [Pontibacter burrus]NEM98745.1 universal stress protein [Pontibacter burrus]